MSIGILKWYNETKGFGLIGTPDKGDFFLHYSNLKKGLNNLEVGTILCFKSTIERNRNSAKQCKLIESFEDFIVLLEYLEKKDTVGIEMKVKRKSCYGNTFTKKEVFNFSLIKKGFQQLDEAKLIQYIKMYYDEILNKSNFIHFCTIIENSLSADITSDIFSYFGDNINSDNLFTVWEERAFQFIGKDKNSDYEIPQEILLKNIEDFSYEDLERIRIYEYGEELVSREIRKKINNCEETTLPLIDLHEINKILKKLKPCELKKSFNKQLQKYIESNILEQIKYIGEINSEATYQAYNNLKNNKIVLNEKLNNNTTFLKVSGISLSSFHRKVFTKKDGETEHILFLKNKIYSDLNEESAIKINLFIDELILENVTPSFTVDLWLKDFEVEVTEEQIKVKYRHSDSSTSDKVNILKKVNEELRRQLLKSSFENERPVKGYSLVESFLKDFNNFDSDFKLKNHLFEDSFWANEESRTILFTANSIVEEIATSEEKFELYISGLYNNLSESIKKQFKLKYEEKYLSISEKVSLLKIVDSDFRMELLSDYFNKERPIQGYHLVERFLKDVNSLTDYFRLRDQLFNEEYWAEEESEKLISKSKSIVEEIATSKEKFDLYFLGLYETLPESIIEDNISSLSEYNVIKIVESKKYSKEFVFHLLTRLADDIKNVFELIEAEKRVVWIYSVAKRFLELEKFNEFDKYCFNELDESVYYFLWNNEQGKFMPTQFLIKLFNESSFNHDIIKEWRRKEIISREKIFDLVCQSLVNLNINNRINFYKIIGHIKAIINLEIANIQEVEKIGNEFYSIILWYLGYREEINFDLLKKKFIYFNPKDQELVVKKIFYSIKKGFLSLSIEQINQLMRVDADLYKTNKYFNPDILLDISTDIVIKALFNYKQKQKFLIEGELIEIVLNNLVDRQERFKIKNYFEKCKGRMVAEYNWNKNGTISRINFGDKYYYCIDFEYNPSLVEKVKKLPNRKYNPTKKHWGVPSRNSKEVIEFAKKNKFFLNFEGSKYTNNIHLVEYKREKEAPTGITFCDGRISNKLHDKFNKEFWWCKNQPCFQNCETTHEVEDWQNYTMFDFLLILGFDFDETKTNPKDFVPKGKYYKFVSLLNRFSRLLEKLYCNKCENILYPSKTSHFALHTVVKFCCENNTCAKHKEEIYLNNCLNGKCNAIIDSRVSMKCPNGLYICEKCGSCCSHSFYKRRKESLEQADNFDNSDKVWIYEQTKAKYESKAGHLEKAEYYCHKDGMLMEETSIDVHECSCGNKYDIVSHRIERPHRELRKTIQIIKYVPPKDDYKPNPEDDLPF